MMPYGRTEVLTPAEEGRWRDVLDRVGKYDFCHLPAFSRLAEQCGQGTARLLAFEDRNAAIAFPLLLRDVDGLAGGAPSGWRDATSVYGYAGPIASAAVLPESTRVGWQSFLDGYLREQNVVAAFSRLHPLLEQNSLLAGYGEVAHVGWTLSLDLRLSDEEQWSSFRRNHRQDIKRLVALGATCEEAGPEQLDEFVGIYYDTMDRVEASPDYYFSKDYFARLLEDMADVAVLLMCGHEGRAIAGSIFTLCQGICQWYFSGSRTNYDGPPPTKLLFEAGRTWAKAHGAHTLHLGGGVGGKRDSLYHFKSGFAQQEREYATWRHVLQPAVYEELYRLQCQKTGWEPTQPFFPSYRHPEFAPGAVRFRFREAVVTSPQEQSGSPN